MKLSRTLSSILFLALSLTSAHAADRKKKSAEVETKKVTEVSRPSSSYSGESEAAITFSIGAVAGNFVFGPGFQQEWPVIIEGNQFAVGWQTGFYYASTSETAFGIEAKSKAWGIPILATGKYIFDSQIGFLKPYFALAFGLGIDHVSGDVFVAGAGSIAKKSETNLHFAMFARPGLTFGESQRWFAELPMGILFTDFAIMPTIGYRF